MNNSDRYELQGRLGDAREKRSEILVKLERSRDDTVKELWGGVSLQVVLYEDGIKIDRVKSAYKDFSASFAEFEEIENRIETLEKNLNG